MRPSPAARAAEGKPTTRRPTLEIVESAMGAAPMTVTRWKAGGTCALPEADAIVFERQGEVLGYAPWGTVADLLHLRPLPGYPTRCLAASPEGWQLATLDLKPWRGA